MELENLSFEPIQCGDLKKSLEEYVSHEFRPEAIQDLKKKLANPNEAELKKDFGLRLEFGTAGLRGPMKVCGTNAMNCLTVLQTSQGLAKYLKKRDGEGLHIVIGYDGRYNSKDFAEYAAAAMLACGFTVSLFGSSTPEKATVTPTPFTPYYLVQEKAHFGIQVTASHNPKDDNGYKVYDTNGAQIIPPVDADIAAEILNNLSKWDEIDALKPLGKSLQPHVNLKDPYASVMDSYFKIIGDDLLEEKPTPCPDLKVVYTAMHGVGSKAVHKMAETAQFDMKNFFVVDEQDQPDPEFTTVSFPNPEEAGALDMAMAKADSVSAPLVFANDPDADRFAFCEKVDGKWHRYHGDEIGMLLSSFIFKMATEKRKIPAEKCLLACSAVSSGMMKHVIESKGATCIDTLTGFKWIMNEGMGRAKTDNLEFIFGYEEALGFACSPTLCPDKDGVSATGVMLQQAQALYAAGETFMSRLMSLRKEHGFFVSNNSYVLCHDKPAINAMFKEFRNDGKYCEKVGDFAVTRVRDVTTGYDNGETDLKCRFPLTPSANMVTLYFDFGRITIRTSGTEPKLKWYAEGCGANPEEVKKTLETLVFAVIDEIFKPEKYPLEKVPKRN